MLTPGSMVSGQKDSYIVRRRIAEGGMGIVHLATDSLGNKVVLKEPHFKGDPKQNIEKLRVEADILEQLNHNNIVKFIDRRDEGNTFYLVVEYVDGAGLFSLFLNKLIGEDEADDYILQLCDAVDYMHDRNVIHRDLKPQNIMVSGSNFVKLIDFGTAKHYYTQTAAARAGTIVLTYGGWTAPEQQKGIANFQSDIYSMGAVLYFLLTGKLPADCVTSTGKLRPPCDLNPNARRLSNVALKAMEYDSNKRYQTVDDLISSIKGIMAPRLSTACIIFRGKRYPLSDETLLGRDRNCDITFPDPDPRGPFISRKHAKIYFRNGHYWIEDQGSANGTYVVYTDSVGKAIYKELSPKSPWALQDNDVIALCYDKTLGPYLTFKFQKPR